MKTADGCHVASFSSRPIFDVTLWYFLYDLSSTPLKSL